MWCLFTGTAGSNPALSASLSQDQPLPGFGTPRMLRSRARLRRPTALSRSTSFATFLVASTLALSGCRTRRVMEVTSDPAGAVVRLDEEIVGETPLEIQFTHYGRRRLTLYLPGYRTWTRRVEPKRPWYSVFPLDFVTEVLLPLGLEHRHPYHAELQPDTGAVEETGEPATDAFVERAVEVRAARREADGVDER